MLPPDELEKTDGSLVPSVASAKADNEAGTGCCCSGGRFLTSLRFRLDDDGGERSAPSPSS